MDDLKPCPKPFGKGCGPFADIQISKVPRDFGGHWWHVSCRTCGIETDADETERGAIARWNDAPRKSDKEQKDG